MKNEYKKAVKEHYNGSRSQFRWIIDGGEESMKNLQLEPAKYEKLTTRAEHPEYLG